MKYRYIIFLLAACFAAGYFVHDPLPAHHKAADYDQADIGAVNHLAVPPVNLLQRHAPEYNEEYGLTGEPDSEPRDTIGEKR